MEEAEKSLKRLSHKEAKINTCEALAMTVKTDFHEHETEVGTTYSDCWKGTNRCRMEICILLFIIQNFSGNPVGFATYLLE